MSETYRGSTSLPSAFQEFEHMPRWVAWREEPDVKGRLCKVPYDPNTGRQAKSTDPNTWATYAAARKCAQGLVIGKGRGGVGIVLGRVDNESSLGGADLDNCIDARGRLEPWADEIIRRLLAYAEVSPSGEGAKAFFLYRTADLPELKEAMGGKLGKAFKDGSGSGVEVYLGDRYFTVTGDCSTVRLTFPRRIAATSCGHSGRPGRRSRPAGPTASGRRGLTAPIRPGAIASCSIA